MDLEKINRDLTGKDPLDIIRWGIEQAQGPAVVSTNFRPLEAVLLHMVVQVQPDMPVLWVDTGYNTKETYLFAEQVIKDLNLNIKRYIPAYSRSHLDALNNGIPDIDEEEKHRASTEIVKLEPFQRGLEDLAPSVWFTALRKVQNPYRETLDIVGRHQEKVLKVSPVFHFTDEDMQSYLAEHNLPDETNYYDPTKVLDKRECGLHLDSAKL